MLIASTAVAAIVVSSISAGISVTPAGGGADISPNWFRTPAISPNGRTIVFSHGGDLYSVATKGGRAVPLSMHGAYETRPVWSSDGKHIAFASDRNGNFDVYVMPAGGGEATRLTYHSASDYPSGFTVDGDGVVFESSRLDDVQSALFHSGVLSELYEVSLEGGTPRMLLTTPALNARLSADGGRMIYEDIKGFENNLRKHHTSSIARDIWMHDLESGSHTMLSEYEGEDRHPVWSADEESVYFLSERSGDFNVFKMPAGGGDAEQVTSFEHHPVRDLSNAGDELVFSWHGDIYHMAADGEPQLVPIEIAVDGRTSAARSQTQRSGATGFSVSPNGKEIAFVVRGEVFVTSVDFSTTRRVTNTVEQERSVDFSPDGRSIVYASERGGSWGIYESTLGDDDELYFFSATKIEERALMKTVAEAFRPKYSPDGKKVAFLHNRSAVRVLDIESGDAPTVMKGDTSYSYSDGDQWFSWSPDGARLAVDFYNRGRLFVGEIGLVAADGSDPIPEDVSKSGYSDSSARWAMGGEALIWASTRYGERSHGSWGSESDVMGLFLTQDAYDRFRLSKEEYELQKELKDKREKDEPEEEEDADTENAEDAEETEDAEADGDEDEDEEEPALEIEYEGLESRLVRLTIHSSALRDYAMSPEGDKLYYVASFEGGADLWVRDFREGSTKILAKGAGGAMRLSEDGKTIYMLSGGSLAKIDSSSGKRTGISFSAVLDVDGAAEREHLLEHVWRQAKQKFYRPDLHGVDWSFYRAEYEPKLEGITNNRDFAAMLSELLGELNASHTGGRYFSSGSDGDASTASLGIFPDQGFEGAGIRIAEVIEGGPLDRAALAIEAGQVITHIDGVMLDGSVNYFELLDGKSGQRTRLTITVADGESFDEVIKPSGLGTESQLLYNRWVRTREAIVEEASGGRLGYVHIRGMNDGSFRVFYSAVLGKHYDKEALIVDTRFNGGGWLHDDLVTFLSGEEYLTMYPRNDEAPGKSYFGEPANRWTKPSIVVMSESNYSDAHIFPWAYAETGIGDTVGMPVPGTGTAVWWERLFTGDLVFGIPQVGTKGKDGKYLENTQLEPTHEVRLDPVSAAAGTDTQILKAVEVLLEQLD